MSGKEKMVAFAEDMARLMERHSDVCIEWYADCESDYAYLVSGDNKAYLGSPWCLPETAEEWREFATNLECES